MPNISDYLDWRGDLPLSTDPFNEVDNLIFSEIAYTRFEEIDDLLPLISTQKKVSLKKASELFFKVHPIEEVLCDQTTSVSKAPVLLRKAAGTRRFRDTKIYGFVNEIDAETEVQFCAMTFLLPDHTLYIAFRGTDNTLVGWQEDFNMSFLYETPGQKRAAAYVTEIAAHTLRHIRIGGHSKGGNFAVYGAAFSNPAAKKKIIEVWSNDGPGFREKTMETEEYRSVLPLVHSTVPEHSIVGMIMENAFSHRIVLSSETGLMQHDAMSWQVIGNRFITTDHLGKDSEIFVKTLHKWLDGIDDASRQKFVGILFSALSSGGEEKVSELKESKLRTLNQVRESIASLPKSEQALFGGILLKLAKSWGGVMFDDFLKKRDRTNQT